MDVNAIPEAWDFRFDFGSGSWDEPSFYEIASSPAEDGILVVRRYVADRLGKVPESLARTHRTLNLRMLDSIGDRKGESLPAGTEVALVTRDGSTYSAPVTIDEKGVASIPLSSLRKRNGIIMPAPYPVMMTREIPVDPSAPAVLPSTEDVEFVELIIPRAASEKKNWLLERIWVE